MLRKLNEIKLINIDEETAQQIIPEITFSQWSGMCFF